MKRNLMIAALVLAVAGLMGATEEASFKVKKTYADFEVREYAPYLVAEIEVKGTFGTAGFQSFSPLFEYIDGNNVKKEQIAMTAPVEQRGEKIAMTAPVTQTRGVGSYTVGFVMPAKYTMETIPEPLDERVKIREVPACTMAARTYSGSWGKRAYEKNKQVLLEGLAREGLKPVGEPIFARYNHPGTRPSERRNEIIIQIE